MMGDLGKLIVAKGFKKLPKVQKIARSGHTASTQSTAESADCWCEFERALIVMYFVCRRTASRSVHSIPLQIRTCQPEVRAVEARADVVRCHFRETPPPTEDEIFVVDVVQFLCLDFGLNCKLSFLCTFYRIGPRAKCQNWLNSNSELSLSSIFPPFDLNFTFPIGFDYRISSITSVSPP